MSKPEQITFLKTCPYSLYKESRLDIDPMKIQSTPEQVNYRSMLRMTTVNSLLTSEDVAASLFTQIKKIDNLPPCRTPYKPALISQKLQLK